MNRLSKVFRPFNYEHKSAFPLDIFKKLDKTTRGVKVSTIELKKKSNEFLIVIFLIQLLNNYGFIRQSANGLFYLLPMGQRVIEKLTKLVDSHMSAIGAQKMSCPLLIKESLWHKAGMILQLSHIDKNPRVSQIFV